jgi:hypothetical protein
MQRPARFALFLVPILAAAPGCYKSESIDTAPPADSAPSFSDAREAKSASRDRGHSGAGATAAGEAAPPASAQRWDAADFEADEIAREESRPGLGTAYGETRHSDVQTVGFRRADPSTPDVVFAIRYDDVDGVRAAARDQRSRAFRDDAMQRHGGLSFALLDERGNILSAAAIGDELWAVGAPEQRYSLAIANDTNSAFEVVASVDGLDVIDGRPASFDKRGYIVDPFSSVVIDGWRTSEETVAAFRFSSIDDSYAERMGDGRNIGVIGAAFFREAPQAWDEWRAPEDSWQRRRADPFPGR